MAEVAIAYRKPNRNGAARLSDPIRPQVAPHAAPASKNARLARSPGPARKREPRNSPILSVTHPSSFLALAVTYHLELPIPYSYLCVQLRIPFSYLSLPFL